MSSDAWCDHCDMSLISCPHGAPPPPPPPAPEPKASRVRTSRAAEPGTPSTAVRSTAPRASATRVPGAPAPAPVRRSPITKPGRTPQAAYRPYLLSVVAAADGRIEREPALEALGRRMADVLQRDDLAVGPSGELRWRTAAQKERRAMLDAGLLRSGGPGVWELTRAGYDALDAFRAALAASEGESGSDGSSGSDGADGSGGSGDAEPPTT